MYAPSLIFKFLFLIGEPIKCGGLFENMKVQMVEYHIRNHMFSIKMDCCDIFLGVEWLCTLGLVTMDFKEF
jgi:hypothetical protein